MVVQFEITPPVVTKVHGLNRIEVLFLNRDSAETHFENVDYLEDGFTLMPWVGYHKNGNFRYSRTYIRADYEK